MNIADLEELDSEIQLHLAKTILKTIDAIQAILKGVWDNDKVSYDDDYSLRSLRSSLISLLDIYYGVKTKSSLL